MLPGIPNWFNDPGGFFSDKINDLLKNLATVFQMLIINPYRPPESDLQNFLLGNSWAYGGSLIYAIVVATICLSMFFKKYMKNFIDALVIFFLLSVGAYVFYIVCEQLVALGDQLTQFAFFYTPSHPNSKGYLALPQHVGVFGSIFAGFGILAWGSLDAAIASLYGLVILVFKFLFPIALAMKPLGKRSSQFYHFVIAIGVVSMVVGRPVMILLIELGKWGADNVLSGNDVFVHSVLLIGTLATAALAQFSLMVVAYKASQEIEGRVKAYMNGSVKATVSKIVHPTVRGREAAHQGALMRQQQRSDEARRTNSRRSTQAGALSVAAGAVATKIPDPRIAVPLKGISIAAGMASRHYASKN